MDVNTDKDVKKRIQNKLHYLDIGNVGYLDFDRKFVNAIQSMSKCDYVLSLIPYKNSKYKADNLEAAKTLMKVAEILKKSIIDEDELDKVILDMIGERGV